MTIADITLDPMGEEEFATWLEPFVRRHARNHINAGTWSEKDALQFAATEFRMMLPQGLQSDQQHLFTVRESAGGEGVGMLWIALKMRGGKLDAFVYNLEIDEQHRGRGYGRAAMVAGAQRARELGAKSMSLHVFGSNAPARALYDSLGFVEINVNMSLSLEDGEGGVGGAGDGLGGEGGGA
ncbi:MAG TPA: N-acetyltransferase [Actinospica sp.]|nr:N-acetyltransferase [Actinospica sp.]